MTRPFQPISDAAWPESAASLHGGFASRLNVYRTMAHHPALLAAWAPLRAHVVTAPALTPEQSEIVILRTGHQLNADYEWAHHVHRARKLGMGDARIQAVSGPLNGMAAADATLAGAVDALLDQKSLPAPLQDDLMALVGVEGMFDLIATVGFYSVLGYIVNSFDTPVDDNVAEGLRANPLPRKADQP